MFGPIMMDGNAEICCAGGALGMEEKKSRLLRSRNGSCGGSLLFIRRLVDATQRCWLVLVSVPSGDSIFDVDRSIIIAITYYELSSPIQLLSVAR